MFEKRKIYFVPLIGFAVLILFGMLVLKQAIFVNYDISWINALYTSVSAVTCTGLTKVVVSEQYTFWGQFVIAILMEIGALGFIVFLSYFWIKLRKKIHLSDVLLINEELANGDPSEVKDYILFIISILVKIQLIGVICYCFVFIGEYGVLDGIWKSVFQAISAFSNSGFDNLGSTSMIKYSSNNFIQLVTIALMLSGSIGVFTLYDVRQNITNIKRIKLQSKIIFYYSISLIIISTIMIKLADQSLSIINSLFLSVSARTTGFTIINVASLSVITKYTLIALMFIGGSTSSTAGGIRIVNFAIIMATIVSTLKGSDETIIFWKKISNITVRKAFTIFTLFLCLLLIAIVTFINYNSSVNVSDVTFECVSALTNTGYTTISADQMGLIEDWIIMILMYAGKVGPLTMLFTIISEKDNRKLIDYPTENIIV